MLRFMDGFDHYSIAQILRKWSTYSFIDLNLTLISGRYAGSAIRYANNSILLTKTLDSQTTWIVGFALRVSAFDTHNTPSLISLYSSTTNIVYLRLNGDGTLSILNGSDTVLGTTSYSLSLNVWYYVEIKIVHNASTGTAAIHVNGLSKLTLTGLNTGSSSNVLRLGYVVGGNYAIGNYDFDDLYVCDGSGSVNNDFLGDMIVEAIYPNNVGSHSDLTKGGSTINTNNYQQVNEHPSDDDSTYVETITPNNIDSYTFSTLSTTPSVIKGIQHNIVCKKTDAGSKQLAPLIRSGGTDYPQTTQALPDSYVDLMQINETDPNTSAAWTPSGLIAAQFGEKIIV